MFKMKYICNFLVIGITCLASCNKLDETAYSNIPPDAFFTTKTDVNAALTAIMRSSVAI